MKVTQASLEKVDSHWAVLAVGAEMRDRGLAIADLHLVRKAVGQQIQIESSEQDTDADLLQRLAMAYELAAIEGLSALCNPGTGSEELREQCAAGAWRAFELRRLFEIPDGTTDLISHVLHLSALAYSGDRWSDLRRWYNENGSVIEVPSVADANWSLRLLCRLFECWIRLFRKKRWDDLDRIREIIAGLREDQSKYEADVIDTGRPAEDRATAIQLIALYHWAKATELLAAYMLQGEPAGIGQLLDKHFEAAIRAGTAAGDAQLEVMLRWLYAASRQMVSGSVWWVARAVNSRVSRFTQEITKQQALFELLPPQRAALQEQGLLDQAATAIVIDMPTSGGKTLLAQFRILQALNQFDAENGWVAYVAPTRALTSQLARRLRRDFEPIGIRVEQLTGAVDIDPFENDLLTQHETDEQFHVLVSTPEKLHIVIRNNKVQRPLALVVMDEAHNIEDRSRGLRIELLLATVKQDCRSANFLLLMPYVPHPEAIARWLADDISAGRTISFGTSPWRPNERIVGMYWVKQDSAERGGWRLVYRTLTTSPKTIHLKGDHHVGDVRPLDPPWSKVRSNLGLQSAAMARVMADRGTSIAVGRTIRSVWTMAREVASALPASSPIPDDVRLVQEFLAAEIGKDFELVEMLARGVAVHHAGLSDEARALIEWLCESGQLKVLCATSTIAQGINFPVSSVFLASRFIPARHQSFEMPPRDFWNLAGRAGRMNHDSVGVVGIAAGDDPSGVIEFVSRNTEALVSNLVRLLDEVEAAGQLSQLDTIILSPEWVDFRCYIAHLWTQKANLEAVLVDAEQVLRNTYGYGLLRATESGKGKAERLLEATKSYARRLADSPGHAELADATGFSPEGVRRALAGLGDLQKQLTPNDWLPESLFGTGTGIAELYGVMLRIPQLAESFEDLTGPGRGNKYLSEITMAWVNGANIQDIALRYFDDGDGDRTKAISDACRAIYRSIVNAGTWGISALSQLSGIDFGSLSAAEQRRINALPAMIYHGVRSENAVLMRMNNAPRSVSEALGEAFAEATAGDEGGRSVDQARSFLRQMSVSEWGRVRPAESPLTGAGYRRIWSLLSGEVGQ